MLHCDYALKTNDVADVLIWSGGVFRSGGGKSERTGGWGLGGGETTCGSSFDHP